MEKRFRDKRDFEVKYDLAVKSCEENWTLERTYIEIELVVRANTDLRKSSSEAQQIREMRRWSDHRLCGYHRMIRDIAEKIYNAEPAGTKKRLNHEFDKICKESLDDPRGVDVALRRYAASV